MKQRKMFGLVLSIAMVAALIMPQAASAISEDDIRATINTLNDQLAIQGEEFRITSVEYYTEMGDSDNKGKIVYANDRDKHLGSHWVPGDPRRGGYTDIAWLTDFYDGTATGLSFNDTQTAVFNAMATWDNVQCATIPLTYLGYTTFDVGYVQWLLGYGGIPGYFFDVTQAGWITGDFFDALAPGGSNFILGVTFTFIWIDTLTGLPTDIDGNGKNDVAFREINYNNNFLWSNDGSAIDAETVVLHEMGHGLSLGHFGKIFRTGNGKLHFAPRCVMNAAYAGIQRELHGADNGSFCSLWSNWPY
jgi:hypothetical protein